MSANLRTNKLAAPEADAFPDAPGRASGRSFESIHMARKKASKRMLRRIARFRKSGNEKSAQYLERCYERSQHAKTTALIQANADMPKSSRLDLFRTNRAGITFPSTPDEESKLARDRQHLLALADGPGMSLSLQCDEEVKILWKQKSSGTGYRNMHAFGIQKRARHLITSAVMKPHAKAMADTRQFGIFGGGHQAAVARVKELVSTGSPWIIERDIINAFPSYDLRPSEITGYRFQERLSTTYS